MQLVSYNLNGIRSAIEKGLLEWLNASDIDIFCVQETKAHADQIDFTPFEESGYFVSWTQAEKKGYSGVATFSKVKPDQVISGFGVEKYDREGRIIRTDFGSWTVLNCYFPSGTTGDVRQDFKMEFLEDFTAWIKELLKERPRCIVVGDFNIAHHPIDIHDPKGNKNSSGFLPEERAWMDQWLELGFTDAFRFLNPTKVQYSWWSFRANARGNNKGWRIDYQMVSTELKDFILEATQLNEVIHSDHCPVQVNYRL
jgi:exodeoxyribonuclease-3